MQVRSRFTGRQALAAARVVLVASLALPVAAQEIVVATWGGAYAQSQRRAYFEPFAAATGFVVREREWSGDLDWVRLMVERGEYGAHLLDAESGDVLAGCEAGVLEPINYNVLGLSPDDFLVDGALECGVGTVSFSTVLAFHRERIDGDGPRDWSDFFDLARFPGPRGLQRGAAGNLEIALLSEGVPVAEVYAVLATRKGVERALARLDSIRPHVVWWTRGEAPARLLLDGEVVMTSAWNGRIHAASVERGAPLAIVWDGQIMDYSYWIIPRRHPGADLAHLFIAFASRQDRQGEQSSHISYGNVRVGAEAYVSPEMLPHLPTAPENTRNWLKSDTAFWAEHKAALEKRFEAWLAR